MKELDILKMKNSPAFDALQQLQKSSAFSAALKLETTGAFVAARELQSTLNTMKTSMVGANTALEEYSKIIAPISESIKTLNLSYAPIFEQTKTFDALNIKGIISGLQTSPVAMSAISELNLSRIASIIDSLPKYDFLSDMISEDFSVDDVEKLYEDGEITQKEINEEIAEIVNQKQFSPQAEWDKIKKSKWFIAIKILFFIVCFICEPVVDDIKEKTRDTLGITEFWEESGIYELIDTLFSDTNETAVSETEAKATVDKNKIGNISKRKREDLLDKIKEIRTFISAAPQDENTGNLLSYLSELEKDVCGKKYGLMFEEHREEIDEVLATHTPVLTEQSDLFISNGGEMNYLIEGDNIASLQLLEKTHKGKIDIIYIDPPYNTGSPDFKYNDTIVAKEDAFRHSKWISFMKCRLQIAHKLLSDNGVIFISIDENEQAPLKLLCDEIFSPENHIETVIWKNKYGAGAKTVGFISVHEYILCYSKKPLSDLTSELDKEGQAAYKKIDDKFEIRGGYLTQPLMTKSLADRPNLMYDIEYNGDIIHPRKQWVWSKERLESAIRNDEVEFNKQKDGTYSVRAKKYLFDEDGNIRRGKPLSILNGPFTQDGTQEIRNIFGSEDVFKFSKPSELIKYFIAFEVNGMSNKNDIILDFFAGSGTTAQAVLAQNQKDNGNRRFILCTNNENNICREVTYERVKHLIEKEDYAASLKYYKVNYIPISERMYYEYADELLAHTRELVELENSINFVDNSEIGIVLTEEELEDFINSFNNNSSFSKVYLGHDILLDAHQAHILKEKNVTVNVIPDYYYRELEG